MRSSRSLAALMALAALALLAACGDDGGPPATPRAATIEVSAGGGQEGEVGENLAVAPAVLVRDSAGNPVRGALVTFTARAGQLASASARTNANGIASAGTWRLPERSGLDTVVATVSGVQPLLVTARVRAGAPEALVTTNPTGFQSRVFEQLDLPVFRVVDRFGNGVPGVAMTLTVLDKDGDMPKSRVLPASEPTDDFGIVGATSWIPYVVGEHRVEASVGNGAFKATATRRVREDACGARRVAGTGMTISVELDATTKVAGCGDTLDVVTVVATVASTISVAATHSEKPGTIVDDANVRTVWLTRAPAWAASPQVIEPPAPAAPQGGFSRAVAPGNYDVRVAMPRAVASRGTLLVVTVSPTAATVAARQR